ncbi:hypothetical protein G647_07838 [Cladophialophora carrionii CBS 160.54]|uniref:Methyltransferase domain-containing protein n=1 Tax=Cladophialophora carrionii CBS 160.54 TaxID=1279043 RepID=V9D4B7_9EURO|nr:uncharacterized protein G647_07838 [Cladophialophora carrionii CBS 160.54]ETI21491.1 hypothetical protein G647_07838 [Cladophialophora carrionii CBS 160.54]
MGSNPAAESGDNYILSRNFLSSARLTAQHSLFVLKNGFLLHPEIAKHIQHTSTRTGSLEIADIAAGNRIVGLTLAHEHPRAKVVALDVSTEQYPPVWTRPENIDFGIWNFFDPLPEEFVGRFDVVHVRAICAPLMAGGREAVIKKLVQMLKPGGYIQWYETVSQCFAELDQSLDPLPLSADYFRLFDKYVGLFSSIRQFDRLATELESEGLVEVERTDSPIMPYLLEQETDFVLWSCDEVLETLRRRGGILDMKELEVAQDQLTAEVARGKCLTYTMATFIGRKT